MDCVNHIQMRVELGEAKQVVRTLLHAILFHRILDNVEPETQELMDADVAMIPTKEVEREVSGKVDEFAQSFVETGAKSGERKNRKGWFAVTEELVPWEEHLITLDFGGRSRGGTSASTSAMTNVTDALFQIARYCLDNRANVPPLVGSGTNLSHQILISPPPPNELFAPSSPPTAPARLTSPHPPSTTPATALAKDVSPLPRSHAALTNERRASSPAGPMGYLEQAKDGLLAVGAKAGERVGWGRGGAFRRDG